MVRPGRRFMRNEKSSIWSWRGVTIWVWIWDETEFFGAILQTSLCGRKKSQWPFCPNISGFDYVLVPETHTSEGLCFSSKVPREVLPVKGPAVSSNMRPFIPEQNPQVGPGSYSTETPKILRPKISAFIPKAPRLLGPKPIYLIEEFFEIVREKPTKNDAKPFGVGVKVKRAEVTSKVPG